MYINCKTWYSLQYGTFSTEGLVQAAGERGLTALGLTNINTTSDTWEFKQKRHLLQSHKLLMALLN